MAPSPRRQRAPALSIVLLGLGLSCGDAADVDCEAQQPGLSRDRCYAERLSRMPANERARVGEAARAIDDPFIRSEAVIRWVSAHAASFHPPAGQELCLLVDPADSETCARRLNSPHLKR